MTECRAQSQGRGRYGRQAWEGRSRHASHHLTSHVHVHQGGLPISNELFPGSGSGSGVDRGTVWHIRKVGNVAMGWVAHSIAHANGNGMN